MSHIVSIETKVRDQAAIFAACNRLGIPQPQQGKARIFETDAEGLLVQLPGWSYPAVIDTASGTIKYDNFEGSWGDKTHLDRFLQAYAVEKAKIEARQKGHSVTEQMLANGSIKLSVQVN